MSAVVENIRINGKPLDTTIATQVVAGSLKLSARSVTSFDFTIQDQQNLYLTGHASEVFREGTTILWEDFALSLSELETGGGTKAPTIQVSAISDFVHALKKETGGKSWGTTSVSAWAGDMIRANAAKAVVQPGLGDRPIERAEPKGNGTRDENTWDVMAEMAKQTGSWLFEYGNTIYMAKPSWLIAQGNTRRYQVVWNSWTDHTDALTAAPEYYWSQEAREWEGKERLTIKAVDPGPGSTNPLSSCRPGDIVNFTGAANPTDNPEWLVVSVVHPIAVGAPVTITCWRAVDPPEILPDPKDGGSEGGDSTAGVPNGPIGALGWQGEQLKNATEIVKEGQRRNLPMLAIELAVCCAMGESSLRILPYGDVAGPDSTGLFQQRDTWGPRSDRMSPGKSAGLFYAALVRGPYQDRYNNGANALSVSNVGAVFIGPGKSGNSASVAIHHVQINADPYHYSRFWSDARLVVSKCIAAGKSSGSGSEKLSGPLGQKIEASMKAMEGKLIEFDGAYLYQCVDPVKQYVADLTGIRNAMGNGNQWWMNPSLSGTFDAIPVGRPPRKGDIASWSGSHGAYPNGGVGHVAIYSHSQGGVDYYLSQNPGPTRIQPLQRLGVQGWMRPKG